MVCLYLLRVLDPLTPDTPGMGNVLWNSSKLGSSGSSHSWRYILSKTTGTDHVIFLSLYEQDVHSYDVLQNDDL